MSKRRKREAGFEVKEKAEERERPKKEKVSEARVVKPGEVSTKKIMVYSIVVAAIFFGAGLFASPAITGYSVAEPGTTNDQLIFISPSGCANCEEMEPLVKEVADTLGVSFTKTGFSQQLENPGFVLVYNDNF
ncbi:MAG: hypothetical protein KAW40_02505, partial [Candidatus Aenigmarchaeota archaeon]|nr:hypothetical protein [Candidatus Aenigmarchaeota archaeon]